MITAANVIVSRIKHSICCCCLSGSINNPRSTSPKREEREKGSKKESEGRVDTKREAESTPANDEDRFNQQSPGKEALSVVKISWIPLSSLVQSKDQVFQEKGEETREKEEENREEEEETREERISGSQLTFHHIKCTSQSILS